MKEKDKMTGMERRRFILRLLQKENQPITGRVLADKAGVSRQVIVTDIALLKTSNEPIVATNRGYLYVKSETTNDLFRRVIVCQHGSQRTKEELEAIVDCGVTVVDVTVEHPIYGQLTGSLMISSRYDVEQFIASFTSQEASLLSSLTAGIHLHTLEADSMDKIDAACQALKKLGILYMEK